MRWMVEARCITTKRGGLQGWIATALPGRVRVLARLASDYGDPLRSRYEHVDYESTCIDCGKISGSPQPCPMWGGLALRPRTMATRQGHYVYAD